MKGEDQAMFINCCEDVGQALSLLYTTLPHSIWSEIWEKLIPRVSLSISSPIWYKIGAILGELAYLEECGTDQSPKPKPQPTKNNYRIVKRPDRFLGLLCEGGGGRQGYRHSQLPVGAASPPLPFPHSSESLVNFDRGKKVCKTCF